ncbi:hypothetical protein PFICI_09492 [Pestalotiopsis fici W106-1]|uniref:Transcription factor domain-containing protein n=1 Tax=Pestalotiopsis fici (strain W106-1 / CGMCC3.15140) TaxID=1229662 RepID=W3X0S6_PESFW|nr:uncharacterized protein PFICI_09492 [Pestalotiopsis fici W106-1]ETS79639.1 hypothetical protein PFICI_09492 [Pestalotiopsis fici W106-1]
MRDNVDDPIHRDFLISARLNHLHVLFLLSRVPIPRLNEPNDALVDVACQMLQLVVETILIRDELANSGTTVSWKVAYYGLPAAGIIILATLRKPAASDKLRTLNFQAFQDLVVFGSELTRGTVVKPGDPNYALLLKAAHTIHRFLDFIHSGEESQEVPHSPQILQSQDDELLYIPELDPDFWSSEASFWEGLADHPFLDTQFS